jgi:small subunit ribosomal protein S1
LGQSEHPWPPIAATNGTSELSGGHTMARLERFDHGDRLLADDPEYAERARIWSAKVKDVHEFLVDIGFKSEGSVPMHELEDLPEIKVGQELDVLIERLEDRDGMVVLSHEKAEFKKNWARILSICEEGGTIQGKVKAVVKGGLLVNIGVEAFLPASQVDVSPPRNLQSYVGQTYEFKVVKLNQERQNIVLSRRELIEQERRERRTKLLAEMLPGDIRKGTVKKTVKRKKSGATRK